MNKVRRIQYLHEEWASVNDVRKALHSDELIMCAAAMLKVSVDKGDLPIDALRNAIAYFFTQATGVLDHLDN